MSDNSTDDGRTGPEAAPWTPATDARREQPADAGGGAARPRKAPAKRERAAGPSGEAPLRRPARAKGAETAAAETAAAETDRTDADAEAGAAASEAAPEGERIAKAIARAGLASRRDAEALIAAGRVSLNGQVLDSPAVNVTDADRITVDGEPLPARERTRLWIFHKPRGLVTTARDPEGRTTVFEALPDDLPRVVAVGRLDINTEGLLLLTNDGGLAKVIAHPDTGWLRRYRVRAHGDTDQAALDRLSKGVTIDGMEYGPVEATLDRVQGDNLWLTLGLREGKNREVKRILEHLGLSVNRLIRLSFGPFQLGDLEAGLVEEVRTKVLKEQLGKNLADQAGVDFESPVREPIAPFGSPKAAARTEARPSDRRGEDAAPPRARRDSTPRGAESRPARPATPERVPTGGMGAGPRRSVWRADEDTAAPRKSRPPRRGADPKVEREAEAAARGRQRVGAIRSGERRVLVERLGPSPETPVEAEPKPRRRYARDDAPPREAARARTDGERAPRRAGADRPRPEGGRPPARDGEPGARRQGGFGGARAEGAPSRAGGRPGGFKDRARAEGGERGARAPRGEAREGDGFKPRGEFKPRSEFKPRGEGARAGGPKSGAPRAGATKFGGPKSGGARPAGAGRAGGAGFGGAGKPGGRPGPKGAPRPGGSGGRPGGGRPSRGPR